MQFQFTDFAKNFNQPQIHGIFFVYFVVHTFVVVQFCLRAFSVHFIYGTLYTKKTWIISISIIWSRRRHLTNAKVILQYRFFYWSAKIAINVVDMFWCCCCELLLLLPFYFMSTRKIEIERVSASVWSFCTWKFHSLRYTIICTINSHLTGYKYFERVLALARNRRNEMNCMSYANRRNLRQPYIHHFSPDSMQFYHFHVTSKNIVFNIAYIFIHCIA